MKNILLLFFSLVTSLSSFATNYYLSNSGSNLNSGTSALDPWQTIDQLNLTPLQPGDSIFFECGSVFRGQINITSGGNDADPIYFGKYGTGNLPVISGAEVVSGWTNYSGNIYKAAFIQTPAHLFADDKQMTIARYPNSGYIIHQNGISHSGFIDTNLIQPDGYWNDATVRMRTTDVVWETNKVDSFSNHTVLFVDSSNFPIADGYGYYFDNLSALLDTAKEWYYDGANQTLYFNAPGNADPTSLNVEASVYDYGFLIENGSGNIIVENMQVEKQRGSGIFVAANSHALVNSRCIFKQQGEAGISSKNGSTNFFISQNQFNDINGFGVSLFGALDPLIAQDTFMRIGLIAGYGAFSTNNQTAIECNVCDSATVSFNEIDSTGGMGIFGGMTNSFIFKNKLSYCLLNTNSLGSIYVFGANDHASSYNKNIVLYSMGSVTAAPNNPLNAIGIYLDEYTTDDTVDSNTVAFATSGILIAKGSSNNLVRKNVVYGCTETQLQISEGSEGSTVDNKVTSNIFYSLSENSDVAKLYSSFKTFNPAQLDSNYYFNPYAYPVFKTVLGPYGTSYPTYYTLEQWQNRIGMDQNSRSTFFHSNRFFVTDTIGNNLISNSFFTNNLDGWISNESDTFDVLLDNSTPLDFGCMKLVFVYSLPDTVDGVYISGFKMDSGQLYQFHLSNYSVNDGNVVLRSKENDDFSGNHVASPQAFPFDNSRHDYDGFITPTQSCLNCLLRLEINNMDSVVWLDNVTFYNVNGVLQEPEKKSRLFLNTSNSSVTFDLGDSIFFNLDQIPVSGSFTLAPYSSAVLIFDSSMILSVHEQVTPQLLKVFPNPVSSGGTVTLVIPQASDDCEISICDLQGKKIFNKMVFAPQKNFQIKFPSFISPGTYFISVRNKYSVWSGKIVVM